MPDSDASLLKSFAANRGEKAFRALTDRYIGLIYHIALRRTGNRTLSEEIGQNVLCALAKKAGSLAEHPERLAAWLHRATIYESLKAMRSESAHQRRKELRHPDEIPAHAQESPWTDALPILDASLDKLSEADRTVLLLHFFENQSFPQISRALGKSTDAVQKQSRRALEKLARLLRGKGIALSVTGIATGLSVEFAKAAPISFATAAAGNALASSASNPTALAMIASKPKYLAPIVLLICAIPLAIQQTAISKAESRNAELQARLDGSSSNPRLTASNRVRPTDPKSGISSKPDFIALANQWDETRRALGGSRHSGGVYPDLDRYFKSLESLDNEALVQLIRDGVAAEMDQAKKYPAIQTLLTTLAERDPKLALDTAVEVFPPGTGFSIAVAGTGIGSILGDWAAKDPEAAWKWFSENRTSEKIANMQIAQMMGDRIITIPTGNQSPFGHHNSFLQPLAYSLIISSLPLARELMETIPMGQRGEFLHSLDAFSILRSIDSKNGPLQIPRETTLRRALAKLTLTREFAPMSMEKVLPAILNDASFLFVDRTSIHTFLENAQLTEDEKIIAARHFARGSQDRNRAPVSEEDIQRYNDQLDLTSELAPIISAQLVAEAKEEKRNMDAKIAKAQIEILKSQKDISDDRLIKYLTRHDFSSQIDEAIKQAERISDPEKRRQVIEQLWKNP